MHRVILADIGRARHRLAVGVVQGIIVRLVRLDIAFLRLEGIGTGDPVPIVDIIAGQDVIRLIRITVTRSQRPYGGVDTI